MEYQTFQKRLGSRIHNEKIIDNSSLAGNFINQSGKRHGRTDVTFKKYDIFVLHLSVLVDKHFWFIYFWRSSEY